MSDPSDDDARSTTPDAPAGGDDDARTALDPSSIRPLDVDGVAAIGIGTALWLVALVVSLLLRDRLAESGDSWWIGVALAGFLLGLPGLVFLRWRRDRHRTELA